MPRQKGQTKDSGFVLWAMADAIPARSLKKYLCDLGPRFCPICFSKCAFGERYLALRRTGEILPIKRSDTNAGKQCAPSSGF